MAGKKEETQGLNFVQGALVTAARLCLSVYSGRGYGAGSRLTPPPFSESSLRLPSLMAVTRAKTVRGLYGFRFVYVPQGRIEGWANSPSHQVSSSTIPDILMKIVSHISTEHLERSLDPHNESESVLIEEILHHRTLRASSLFWYYNLCSYTKRIALCFLHARRMELWQRYAANPLAVSPAGAADIVDALCQDRISIDAFVYVLRLGLVQHTIRDMCIPIAEAVWKTPEEAEQYGDACVRVCARLQGQPKAAQLAIAQRVLDMPLSDLGLAPSISQSLTLQRFDEVMTQIESGSSLEEAVQAIKTSGNWEKSTKAAVWYLGGMPDYLFWFLLWHIVKSMYFARHVVPHMPRILFRRGVYVSYPAFWLEGKSSTIFDPVVGGAIPGLEFAFRDWWLIPLQSYVLDTLCNYAWRGEEWLKAMHMFLLTAGVEVPEVGMLMLLAEETIQKNGDAVRKIQRYFTSPSNDAAVALVSGAESALWNAIMLISEREFDLKTLDKALRRWYIHGVHGYP